MVKSAVIASKMAQQSVRCTFPQGKPLALIEIKMFTLLIQIIMQHSSF